MHKLMHHAKFAKLPSVSWLWTALADPKQQRQLGSSYDGCEHHAACSFPSFHHSISRFGHARIALSGLEFVKQLPEQTIMESFQPYIFTVPRHASQHSQGQDGRKYIKSSCTHTHTHTIREFPRPKSFHDNNSVIFSDNATLIWFTAKL